MSNLKKDIEEIIDEHADAVLEARDEANTGRAVELQDKADQRATTQIINLIESVIGEMEHRETEDMSLKSWTPEDYKAFGRNELRADIKSKLIGGIR